LECGSLVPLCARQLAGWLCAPRSPKGQQAGLMGSGS